LRDEFRAGFDRLGTLIGDTNRRLEVTNVRLEELKVDLTNRLDQTNQRLAIRVQFGVGLSDPRSAECMKCY
jgi:hypothetical protein